VKVGELVVPVTDVQGVAAGKVGRVMSVREDAVLVECRLEERLHFVLARTWDLLPETIYRRFLKRQRMGAMSDALREVAKAQRVIGGEPVSCADP
jgi:hypothetical protein